MGPTYLINDAGDIWAERRKDGQVVELDPAVWGWHGEKSLDLPEWRRTVEELKALPGFHVEVSEGPSFVPGPRPARSRSWEAWLHSAAPPAAVQSKGGIDGTLAYFDRLSDAFGNVAMRLATSPASSPFIVNDFVAGRLYTIHYTAPGPLLEGTGRVYIVTDEHGIKIGYTSGPVAKRIAGLQTGNPRTIYALVTIHGATGEVEAKLHTAFAEHQGIGEWFKWPPLIALALEHGGWEPLLHRHLGEGEWHIEVHRLRPYR